MEIDNRSVARPDPLAILHLLKPVTWFPPMWALVCGVVSAGVPIDGRWWLVLGGLVLAGPLVCAMSQAANDWCDRHVDAINEPDRPIPSGRVPGLWGLWIALFWTGLSLAMAAVLGPWALGAAVFAVACAWAYSAEPLRLKRNGWWGNGAVGLCYEGVPWFTGAALVAAAAPDWRVIVVALLFSAGAHGIMTLNDFKALDGDRRMGIGSLPVRLGPDRAARVACWVMALAQLAVIAALIGWGLVVHGGLVAVGLVVQLALMRRLLADPRGRAPWYNATGVLVYVIGMLVSALGLRTLALGAA